MREILFRGKRLDNGEWVEGWYQPETTIRHLDGRQETVGVTIAYKVDEGFLDDTLVDPSTVCQYTGMNDKNGERIFEGDVAKVLQGKNKDIAYVGFENGSFMLYPKAGNVYERTLWSYWYNDWDVEVIGNITDNPELLEK